MNLIKRAIRKAKPKSWIAVFTGDGWNDYYDITCPYCGKTYRKDRGDIGLGNYCPNCGRRVGRVE